MGINHGSSKDASGDLAKVIFRPLLCIGGIRFFSCAKSVNRPLSLSRRAGKRDFLILFSQQGKDPGGGLLAIRLSVVAVKVNDYLP